MKTGKNIEVKVVNRCGRLWYIYIYDWGKINKKTGILVIKTGIDCNIVAP